MTTLINADKTNKLIIKNMMGYLFLVLALLILTTRLATFLHEVFGHAAVVLLSGEDIKSIEVSMFGGGYTRTYFHTNNLVLKIIFYYSGILLNLATGLLILIFSRRILTANIYVSLFLSFLMLSSLNGGLAYIIMGIYYNFGDPVEWSWQIPEWYTYCWIPALALTPFSSYFSTQLYLLIQEKIFPTNVGRKRFYLTILTLGVPIILYATLFFITGQNTTATDAPNIDYERKRIVLVNKKKRERRKQIQKSKPNLTEQEFTEAYRQNPIVIKKEDVPTRFPIIILLILFNIAGGLIAIFNLKSTGTPAISKPCKPVPLILFISAAIIVIAFLHYTDGQIYPL